MLETSSEPQQSESPSSSSRQDDSHTGSRNGSETPTKVSVQAGGQKMSTDTRSTHWDAILNEVRCTLSFYDFYLLCY